MTAVLSDVVDVRQTFAHNLGAINVLSDSKPNRSGRSTCPNFLMFMNPANVTYDQGPAAPAYILPTCNAALFINARKLRVGANQRTYSHWQKHHGSPFGQMP